MNEAFPAQSCQNNYLKVYMFFLSMLGFSNPGR